MEIGLSKATEYCIRMSEAKTFDDLAFVCAELQIDLEDIKELEGWREWLRDCFESAHIGLSDKPFDPTRFLSKEGLKRWQQEAASE